MGKPWIGYDLDKSLAYQKEHKWEGPEVIGRPLMQSVMRIKGFLRKGISVKIFTARVKHGKEAVEAVKDWLEEIGLPRLEVTNEKDHDMISLYDDR